MSSRGLSDDQGWITSRVEESTAKETLIYSSSCSGFNGLPDSHRSLMTSSGFLINSQEIEVLEGLQT
ncbi:hypothetical protein RRG08_065740 [Elysia crispata]|uniref:Uncharacterized protein n=1 Tax=Elysia crispata TaxID=231223 RepID=A0AAE0Z7K7_9GAST|nr:hypothetical protein RRG08_065740 [Elysia crispata]